MQLVFVVVMPEIPDEEAGWESLRQMNAVGKALNVPELEGRRVIATTADTAEAILRIAEPD